MASILERPGRNGTTVFYARVRLRGSKQVGKTFTRRIDAKLWIAETERSMLTGQFLEADEARKHTVAETIERYLADYQADSNRRSQLMMWKKEIGHLFLAALTRVVIGDSIAKWKRETNERGETRGAAILNRYLSTISVVLTAASHDWGWMAHNPARDVRRQKEPRGRMRFLSEDERARLIDACATSYCPYIYPIVILALSTGMRKSEILNLRWQDVDLEKAVILLYKTKNNEPRRVAVRGLALELLKQHNKVRRIDTDYLFPGELTAKNGRPMEITKAWEDARRRAKLENFVFHDLRHSCASYLAMGGATLLEIAEVLGHKTLEMVKRYSHLAESHTANVVERMNKQIFGG